MQNQLDYLARTVEVLSAENERLRAELARAIQVVADYDAELAKLRAAPKQTRD